MEKLEEAIRNTPFNSLKQVRLSTGNHSLIDKTIDCLTKNLE